MAHKNEVMIDNDPDKVIRNFKRKMKKNPWMVTSIVLGVIVIILLVLNYVGVQGTSAVVTGEEAGAKLVDFLNGRTGGGVEFISSEDMGNLYQVNVEYDGQEIPVFVTKDGEYFVQGAVPLNEDDTQPSTDQPSQEQPVADVPKSDKPVVELFVMSHCPYGTQAEKGMIPVYELLGDKIDGEIRFVNYAMHGEKEVYEELTQYCIETEQNDKYLDYLKCFLGKTGSEEDREACLDEVGIDMTKLNTCKETADTEFDITKNYEDQSTWSSGRFPPIKFFDDLNKQYGVQGSPTLVINGQQVSSGRDSASYLRTICNAFNEPPEECDQEIDSTSPSPGFGYDAAASGGATAAQCG